MTTSGSYNDTSTASTIINDAFSIINAHDPGEPLPADKWAIGKRFLNDVVKFMSIHEGLWLITEKTITLTPGTASYAMGTGLTVDTPKPMRITDARKTLNSTDIPLEIAARQDYIGIPNKTLQAGPVLVYYAQGRDSGTLYVWPTGTSTDNSITLTTSRPIQDFDSQGNNPDLPREWVLLMKYMLAELLAPVYLGGNVPQSITAMKNEMMVALLRYDAESTGFSLQP